MKTTKLTRTQSLMLAVNRRLQILGHGSKARLAEWLEVRPAHLSRWLTGTVTPDAEHALAMQEWLDSIKVTLTAGPGTRPLKELSKKTQARISAGIHHYLGTNPKKGSHGLGS